MKLSTTLRNESGAMLVLIALLLVAFLGTFALAVDVGLWLNTKAEAQRAADAAALAGASVWMEAGLDSSAARVRARDYATRNYIGHSYIDVDDPDQFQVSFPGYPDAQRIRVTVGGSTSSLFARFIGKYILRTGASAEARVMGGMAVKCVKPWALPDQWKGDGDNQFEAGERYQRYDPLDPQNDQSTGYGTPETWSEGNTEFGSVVTLVHSDPHETVTSSIALPFHMPYDSLIDTSVCSNVPGGNTGSALYLKNMCGCNQNEIVLHDTVTFDLLTSSTARQGQVARAVQDMIEADPGAYWNDDADPYSTDNPFASEPVKGSSWEHWIDSPRVFRVALFDPTQLANFEPGGGNQVSFNNVALFFLEGTVGNGGNLEGVQGRFIGYPPPASRQGLTTSMPKILQLVK